MSDDPRPVGPQGSPFEPPPFETPPPAETRPAAATGQEAAAAQAREREDRARKQAARVRENAERRSLRRADRRQRRRHHVRVVGRLPRVLWRGLRRPFGEPGVLLLLLLLNLAVAFVLAAPYRGLLSAELDGNLYGDVMQSGASWRWFDTVERRDPLALGDLAVWKALWTSAGVRPADLGRLAGPPAAIAVAALLSFLLHGVLHVGWLATGRWKGGRGAGVASLLHRSALFAAPALALAMLAALAYAAAYAVGWVATGAPLDRLAEHFQSERLELAFVAVRLLATGLLCFAVKGAFDLAKVALVESGSGRWWAALGRGARELVARAWAYLLIYLLVVAGTLLVTAAWWLLSAPLVPQTWLGIIILFLLHQLFVALRIGVRLAGLSALQGTYLAAAGVVAELDGDEPPRRVGGSRAAGPASSASEPR